MNVHTRIAPADAGYDQDTVLWATEQAALLRAGRLDAIDIENIAEEIEDLAKYLRRGLSSQLARIIEHLLKLRRSPATNPRSGWAKSIVDARRKIEAILEESPSLRRELPQLVASEEARTRRAVARTLELYGEHDAARAILADTEPFTVDQVVGDWFPFEATR